MLQIIARSAGYLLLIDVAVFNDWVSAYVFVCDGEVPPLEAHMIASVQRPMRWPVTRKQAMETLGKVIAILPADFLLMRCLIVMLAAEPILHCRRRRWIFVDNTCTASDRIKVCPAQCSR